MYAKVIGFAQGMMASCVPFLLVSVAYSQMAPLEQFSVPFDLDSGEIRASVVESLGPRDEVHRPEIIFSQIVHVPDAPWVRLRFETVQLAGSVVEGDGAFLRMTTLHDGAYQFLDAVSVKQWRHTSAYFNGDTILIELLAYPEADPGINRVVLRDVLTGESRNDVSELSICDGVDERVLSNDPRDARSLPGGCTSWLFNDRHYCLLTAGHCAGSTSDVVEFNVPLQGPNGGWVFAHPNDQYPVDPDSKQQLNQPCVNDWAYFGAFPNSNTGLTMLQAQGDSYTLAASAPPVQGQDIRIRGYGTTSSPVPPPWNRAQKEDEGPFVLSSGTALQYRADTTGGNSGSAVIDVSTGLAIGIHTCGGCHSNGGANVGTAIHHSGLQMAINSPQGVCTWPAPGPTNNTCTTTQVVSDGVTYFDNIDATTDGPDEPDLCDFFGDTNIQADVWFGYIATCTGEVTISLCDSDFAAKLAVYPLACPTESGTVVACNLAACGTRAELTLPVSEGEPYRLRVGGHQGAQGEGVLMIHCSPAPTCPADFNGDGSIDVTDLLQMLSAWGPCADCPEDLNADGEVDVTDLLLLLKNWGPCE